MDVVYKPQCIDIVAVGTGCLDIVYYVFICYMSVSEWLNTLHKNVGGEMGYLTLSNVIGRSCVHLNLEVR